jgi:hypothetical protein
LALIQFVVGSAIFIFEWVTAFEGWGAWPLAPGLLDAAVGGWLWGGWRVALIASVASVGPAILALLATNAAAAVLDRDNAAVVRTPSAH